MSIEKVGLLGGTFNPVHLGHLIVARNVLEQLGLQRVYFIPSAQPPHKGSDDIVAFQHRAAMVALAIEGEAPLVLDECESRRAGPSYTLDTVNHFGGRDPALDLHWIIGADSLAELHSWYRVQQLVDACHIVTVCRPGWDTPDLLHLEKVLRPEQLDRLRGNMLETPRIDVSSTDIRNRVAAGRSIRFLVPEAVRQYIAAQGLYRPTA